jgi:SPP1 gp7 family putative phage head morphogenesis protein
MQQAERAMPAIDAGLLKVLFKVTPEKAVAFLKAKGFAVTWDWQDMWQRAHTTAFTVAKVARMDILTAIRQMTDRALAEGLTFDQFQKSLEPYLKLAGWWGRTWAMDDHGNLLDENGKPFPTDDAGVPIIPSDARPPLLGSPYRLATIYQTNLQVALGAGRYEGMMDVTETRPFWQYVSVKDARTTRLCSSIGGAVYRFDDPFWSYFYPPNHWRCRGRVRTLSAGELKRKGLEVSKAKLGGKGEGSITMEDVLVSKKTGEARPAATIKIGKETFRADPAWSYNPATKPYTPDVSGYSKGLQTQFKRETKKPRSK